MACQQSGTQQRADPEPDGFHVFKDKFDGDEFSIWIKGIVDDPLKAVDEGVYQSILQFVTVNELFAKTLTEDLQKRTTANKGDFWITVDPYQGLRDSHSLMKVMGNQIHWLGNLANGNLLEKGFKTNRIVKLEECFRMPLAMISHIESEKVLPTKDLPKAQDVKSLGVVETNISFPLGYSIQSMAEHLADQLYTKVMKRGIHPGHCAVVFHGGAEGELFPPQDGGLPAFAQLVNDILRSIPAKSHAGHMLQISPNIGETLLYNRFERSTSSASVCIPMVSEISSNVDVEDTVECQAERHAEVIIELFSPQAYPAYACSKSFASLFLIASFIFFVEPYQVQVQDICWICC